MRLRSVLRAILALALFAPLAASAAPDRPDSTSALNPASSSGAPIRVLVAVMPFSVHSGAPLDDLERDLADLLRARLEASGQVSVLDTVVIRQAMVEYVAGERNDSVVRKLARDVGADWVIEGSLTELAGRYSLDVRVTPADSPIPSRSMVFTAEGDEELLERVNELSDRVLEIVVTDVVRSPVTAINFEGDTSLDIDELRAGLSIEVGQAFENERLERDLAELRARPEVGAATVSTDRGADGVEVTFRLVPVERFGGTTGAPVGETVAEIRVEGNRRIEAEAIRSRISTQVGDRFSTARLAEDVRSVNELGFFRNIRVLSEGSDVGRILTFAVDENPVVRQITIAGNDGVDAEKIREQLTLTTGSTLDIPLLIENRERVTAVYQAEGFHLAEVRYEIEEMPNDAVGVHFEVKENKKLKLREIRFEGNEHFTGKELSSVLQLKPWRFWNYATRVLQKGAGVYAEPIFLQDLQSVEEKYADAGFLRAEIGDPETQANEDGLVVVVKVDEGDRFKVGKIDVKGDPNLEIDDVRDELDLPDDEWFNRSHLTRDVDRIEFRYTNQGFYQAEVQPLTSIHEGTKTVDVLFEVEKGPLYFVRQIDVVGNTRTIDPVIRREVNIVEGELYSARAVGISRRRLERLGYFDEVNFEATPTDQEDQVDLDVRVAEKPTGSLSFGAGFSSQDSFILSGSISQNNLFGRGYGLSLSADFGGRRTQIFGSFTNRRFLDSEYGLSLSLFRTEIDFSGFEQENTGSELTFSRALDAANNTHGFLRYGFTQQKIDVDSSFRGASPILRQFEQNATISSRLSLIVATDTRNDNILPTKGYELSFTGTGAGLGGFTKFLRLESRGAFYTRVPDWLPMPRSERSSFRVSAGLGWTLPFNTLSDFKLSGPDDCANIQVCPLGEIDRDIKLPLSDRYFMGGVGALKLRGFRQRSVGPRRAEVSETDPGNFLPGVPGGLYTARGRNFFGQCVDPDGECNDLDDEDIDDFEDLDETDVVGGSKFVSLSTEYRFPISEEIGLVGILFLDAGNAFSEDEFMFDVNDWRVGTGVGALWFSPFGPLEVFWGIPLDPLSVERKSVFEFNVGGSRG